MIIRGGTVSTPIKPERNLVKATNLNEEEKAQARDNIGAVSADEVSNLNRIIGTVIAKEVSTASDFNKFTVRVEDFNFAESKTYNLKITVNSYPYDVEIVLYNGNTRIGNIGTITAGTGEKLIELVPAKSGNALAFTCGADFLNDFTATVSCNNDIDYTILEKLGDMDVAMEQIIDNSHTIYNLIDNSKPIFEGKYIDKASGGAVSNESFYCTDFIKVKPNTKYFAYGMYLDDMYAYYNSDKVFVKGMTINENSFTTPDNVEYVRFTSLSGNPNGKWYLTEYENHFYPYGLYYDSVSRFLGKRFLIFGDSISTGRSSYSANKTASYGEYDKWVDALIKNNTLSAQNTRNDSISITGFVRKCKASDGGFWLDGENNFVQRLQYYIDNNLCGNFDEVILFGGINDFIGGIALDEFKTAVDTFFENLVTNFVHARILVILPLKTMGTTNSIGLSYDDYYSYIKEVARSYSLPCLDTGYTSGFNPRNAAFRNMWCFEQDGVHPNYDYQEKYLAPMIKAFIEQY